MPNALNWLSCTHVVNIIRTRRRVPALFAIIVKRADKHCTPADHGVVADVERVPQQRREPSSGTAPNNDPTCAKVAASAAVRSKRVAADADITVRRVTPKRDVEDLVLIVCKVKRAVFHNKAKVRLRSCHQDRRVDQMVLLYPVVCAGEIIVVRSCLPRPQACPHARWTWRLLSLCSNRLKRAAVHDRVFDRANLKRGASTRAVEQAIANGQVVARLTLNKAT